MDEEKPDTPEKLKARALRYLVRREHSRAELARKLSVPVERLGIMYWTPSSSAPGTSRATGSIAPAVIATAS